MTVHSHYTKANLNYLNLINKFIFNKNANYLTDSARIPGNKKATLIEWLLLIYNGSDLLPEFPVHPSFCFLGFHSLQVLICLCFESHIRQANIKRIKLICKFILIKKKRVRNLTTGLLTLTNQNLTMKTKTLSVQSGNTITGDAI
jgi:hypothetical protein